MTPAARVRAADGAASIHARLLAKAKERGQDFNHVLGRYATERWLYRLSVSPARERFLLKGALLFDLWFDEPHRPTRDADFLGLGAADVEAFAKTVAGVCAIEADDALRFDADSIRVQEIREEANYGGLRVTLVALLGKARCPIQLDVGFGDTVTPAPQEAELPTLLDDQPVPRLRVYPRESVVAEKLEALVSLGIANSRMKDFFDLRALAREGRTQPPVLAQAIAATFARRRTALPDDLPFGLTDEFARDPLKQQQWRAFLSRNALGELPLAAAIAEIRAFLAEPLRLARMQARSA